MAGLTVTNTSVTLTDDDGSAAVTVEDVSAAEGDTGLWDDRPSHSQAGDPGVVLVVVSLFLTCTLPESKEVAQTDRRLLP